MVLIESISIFLLIVNLILSTVVTYLYVRQQQMGHNLERLTQSLTAQIIASGSMNQKPTYTAPPEQQKNALVS
jgi:hypothetical protein